MQALLQFPATVSVSYFPSPTRFLPHAGLVTHHALLPHRKRLRYSSNRAGHQRSRALALSSCRYDTIYHSQTHSFIFFTTTTCAAPEAHTLLSCCPLLPIARSLSDQTKSISFLSPPPSSTLDQPVALIVVDEHRFLPPFFVCSPPAPVPLIDQNRIARKRRECRCVS
jgi:hypothetical protein